MNFRPFCGKTLGLFSVLIGILVLITSGWTLAKTFQYEELPEGQGSDESEFSMETIYNLTYTNPWGIHDNYTITENIEEDEAGSDSRIRLWTRKYKLLVQGSIGGTICSVLVQLVVSMILVCSSPKKLYRRIRLWQLVHFLTILFLLLCILVPLSYNRDKDTFRGTITFGKYMKSELTKLYENLLVGKETILSYFLNGLNSFYIAIIMNICFIIGLIFLSCCVFTCIGRSRQTTYEDYYE